MSDMKLIMENWKGFVNEEFEACKTDFTIGDLMIATDLASVIDDEEKRREKIAKLENDPKWRKNLRKAAPIAKALGKIGWSALTTFAPIPDPLVMASDVRTLAQETGELFGKIFVDANKQEAKFSEPSPARQFLTTFCVDPETLDMIDDKFQKQYFQESDIIDKIKEFFTTNPPETKIPNLTNHLVDWMNDNSPYADSDHTSIKTEK